MAYMSSFQNNNKNNVKGANVNLGQVTQANKLGAEQAMEGLQGFDSIRRIRNKNTIQELLNESDSANYGKNIGEISALAGDTTAGGAGAATLGLGGFQKKAKQDLTGLAAIMAANKGTATSARITTALSKANGIAKTPVRNKLQDETPAQYEKYATDFNNKRRVASRTVDDLIARSSGNTGNAYNVDQAGRTMNKYFDRKMNFGPAQGVGVPGNGNGGNGNGKKKTVIEQVQEELYGPENRPAGYQEPLSMIQKNDPNAVQGAGPGVPFGLPTTKGTVPVITDKSRLLPNGKVDTEMINGNKNNVKETISNFRNGPATKDVRPDPKLKPKPGASFMERLIPGWDDIEQIENKADRKQAKINARHKYNVEHGISDPVTASKATNKTAIDAPDVEKPKGKIRKAVDSISDGVKKAVTPKNLSAMGKGVVRGGLTATTDTGGGISYYDENGKPVEQTTWGEFIGNTPEGAVYSKSGDEITMKPLGKFRRKMAGTTDAKPGFKAPVQKINNAVETNAQGEPVSNTKDTGTNSFTMSFDDKKIVDTHSSAREAKNNLETRIGQVKAMLSVPGLSPEERNMYQKTLASDQAQLSNINSNPDYSTNRMLSNISQSAPTLASKMSKGVDSFIEQTITNKSDADRIKANMSPAARQMFSNILTGNTKLSDKQLGVMLGTDKMMGGSGISLTGKDRQELGKNALMLMTMLTQNPEKVKAFVESRPKNQRQLLYDMVNRKSNSVSVDDRSSNTGRFFRNDDRAGSNNFWPNFSDSDIVKETLNSTVR